MTKGIKGNHENVDDPDENPCLTCQEKDYCDNWEAMYCCTLCHYNGYEDCSNCDPMDI